MRKHFQMINALFSARFPVKSLLFAKVFVYLQRRALLGTPVFENTDI